MTEPIKLHSQDPRHQVLFDALAAVAYERGHGLPVSTVIGIIEMLKIEIIKNLIIEI